MLVDHDLHGRVGPPRCQECNAPLGFDDVNFTSHAGSSPVLCNDCLALILPE